MKLYWLDMHWAGAIFTIAPDLETAKRQMVANFYGGRPSDEQLEKIEEIPLENGQTRVCIGDA